MKFLIDECLYTPLVDVVISHGYEAYHVNWLGLSGSSDWDLMTRIRHDDFTFVTNNAHDFRKIFNRANLHAGLIILVPQAGPAKQRELLAALLGTFQPDPELVNEVIEISVDEGQAVFTRYEWPS